jgi:hypothetical protein
MMAVQAPALEQEDVRPVTPEAFRVLMPLRPANRRIN